MRKEKTKDPNAALSSRPLLLLSHQTIRQREKRNPKIIPFSNLKKGLIFLSSLSPSLTYLQRRGFFPFQKSSLSSSSFPPPPPFHVFSSRRLSSRVIAASNPTFSNFFSQSDYYVYVPNMSDKKVTFHCLLSF